MAKPVVDKEKCNSCRMCIEICPLQLFEMDENGKAAVKKGGCIGCKSCEMQCPNSAIMVEED